MNAVNLKMEPIHKYIGMPKKKKTPTNAPDIVVGKRYKLSGRLGKGSFGDVFKCIDLLTGKAYAIKMENRRTNTHSQLDYERRIYRELKGGVGVPNIHWFGAEGDFNCLVMDLLGESVQQIFERSKRNLSLKHICIIGIKTLDRLKYLHARGFVHRDIKPQNLVLGRMDETPPDTELYLIDFGLSKRFRDPRTRQHVKYRNDKSLTGTPRYASVHTMDGCEQARRDDLESLMYVLIYLHRGKLPWQGDKTHKGEGKEARNHRILDMKMRTSVADLCTGCPPEFEALLHEIRQLRFEEEPDYGRLHAHLLDLYTRLDLKKKK